MCKTIAVALSGGIDSLVTAALLKDQGHQLIGLHFLNGFEFDTTRLTNNGSDSSVWASYKQQIHDSLTQMTATLGLSVHIIDLRSEFKSQVVDYFVQTYAKGKTPNPCMACNPAIKFGVLLNKARSLGASHIATGHYARIHSGPDGRMHLFRGADQKKEQSYFLARLSQKQLSSAIMPLGELNKGQTREIARQKGLQPAATQESQDICFIKNGNYDQFLLRQADFEPRPGPIVDISGAQIGRHNGLHLFTIGQRRGINCPASEPYYVQRIDIENNRLIVAFKHHLQTDSCHVTHINWINEPPDTPCDITVRLRYRHTAVKAMLVPQENLSADITFDIPQAAVSPGQGAVFYREDEVLGGGWIQ